MTTFAKHLKKFLIPILLIVVTVLITLIVSDLFQGCHDEKPIDNESYHRLKLINLSLVVGIIILIAFILYLPYNFKKLKLENTSLKTSNDEKVNLIDVLKNEKETLNNKIEELNKEIDDLNYINQQTGNDEPTDPFYDNIHNK